MTASVMSLVLLTGCQYRITDKTVEEEVAAALEEAQEEWRIESERLQKQAVEEALKAYEVESNKTDPETIAQVVTSGEVEQPDTTVMTTDSLDQIDIPVSEADHHGNEETAVEDRLQIVFMGDSIFDSVRDETGIAAQVGRKMNADIYNLAIGGSAAAIKYDKAWQLDLWSEVDFLGVVYALENKIDRSIFSPYKSGEIMATLDPYKTDYFVIQYGTNDFLSYFPIGGDAPYCYVFSSALEFGIKELQTAYPDAEILVCTPYYMQFWSADRTTFIGDSHTVNNGFGTHQDYINWAEGIANDCGVESLNMYNLSGVDGYTIDKLTVDGIHPNEELRAKYADILVEKIEEMEAAQESEEEQATE
ncbi:MAG: SGNH/GDSL hydrolase family protein [Lachnospiraceae bacterium]|nr:SGNH/GDSL hydrolase family protein [Lachnospiraceae bacterium]